MSSGSSPSSFGAVLKPDNSCATNPDNSLAYDIETTECLTELSNVVAYACRASRTEDRRHDLLGTPQPATSVSASNVFRRPKWLALTALTALTAPTLPEELQP